MDDDKRLSIVRYRSGAGREERTRGIVHIHRDLIEVEGPEEMNEDGEWQAIPDIVKRRFFTHNIICIDDLSKQASR